MRRIAYWLYILVTIGAWTVVLYHVRPDPYWITLPASVGVGVLLGFAWAAGESFLERRAERHRDLDRCVLCGYAGVHSDTCAYYTPHFDDRNKEKR